jgi:hypothetical protein
VASELDFPKLLNSKKCGNFAETLNIRYLFINDARWDKKVMAVLTLHVRAFEIWPLGNGNQSNANNF